MGTTSTASGLNPNGTSNQEITLNISPPHSEDGDEYGDEDDDGEDTETETRWDRDAPPVFPALSSAQRLSSKSNAAPASARTSNALPTFLTDTDLMPPPPVPSKALRVPGVQSSLLSTSSSTLALPPTTTRPPTNLSKPKSGKYRNKVALAPGFGPLDWAALKASGSDLRVSLVSFVL